MTYVSLLAMGKRIGHRQYRLTSKLLSSALVSWLSLQWQVSLIAMKRRYGEGVLGPSGNMYH